MEEEKQQAADQKARATAHALAKLVERRERAVAEWQTDAVGTLGHLGLSPDWLARLLLFYVRRMDTAHRLVPSVPRATWISLLSSTVLGLDLDTDTAATLTAMQFVSDIAMIDAVLS